VDEGAHCELQDHVLRAWCRAGDWRKARRVGGKREVKSERHFLRRCARRPSRETPLTRDAPHARTGAVALTGGMQGSSTATQSLVIGQQIALLPQTPFAAGSQKCPGLVGFRQCSASGQQYESLPLHGDVHGAPGTTQILVSGQQTWPEAQDSPAAQLCCVALRQCFASGQQYSSAAHTGVPTGGVHFSSVATQSLVSGQQNALLPQTPVAAGSQKCPGLVGFRQCIASGQQYELSSLHGDLHSAPGMTQIFVIGQHTCPARHAEESFTQLCIVGVRQRFASGQQYESVEHTG